ncbi:stathmin domain-containing protein 1 [Aulostomus maculatus]
MGCGSSTSTVVLPVRPSDGGEDETESKCGGRGDSAVSKGTTDSGVVMETREIPALPGEVPPKLPPPAFGCVGESRIMPDGVPGFLQQERPESSEILEELLQHGIIPLSPTRESGSVAGEAYNIMLDDRERIKRRPPARLESLKAKKAQNLPSREEIEDKIRLAEERRKLREDELKTRLRTKSARVRRPAATFSAEEETSTPVEPLQLPPPPALLPREEAEGGERRMSDEEEEVTQLEELQAGRLLTASGELENDSSFQHGGEETF